MFINNSTFLKLHSLLSFLLIFALQVETANAQRHDIPLPNHTASISGIPVTFSGTAAIVPAQSGCSRVGVGVKVNLDDLNSKLTRIIKSSGVERSEKCGVSVRIHGARIWAAGRNLGVKVDGNVAKQECIKTKVPEFRGLKVTMKTRIVGSNTFRTNASVEAAFATRPQGRRGLNLQLVSGPRTRVSNDAYKFLISAFNLQGKIDGKLRQAIVAILSEGGQIIKLPPTLQQFGLSIDEAWFQSSDGKLVLNAKGHIPIPANLTKTIYPVFGWSTAGCP